MEGILAIGDCVTSGVGNCLANSYPEWLGRALGVMVKNCGKTMCTSREGVALLPDNLNDDFDCVLLQFGIVDGYTTFKYAPYVLYYPDNFIRKTARNIVKKYKKICRNSSLNTVFGEKNVVPEPEYRAHFAEMIR